MPQARGGAPASALLGLVRFGSLRLVLVSLRCSVWVRRSDSREAIECALREWQLFACTYGLEQPLQSGCFLLGDANVLLSQGLLNPLANGLVRSRFDFSVARVFFFVCTELLVQ